MVQFTIETSAKLKENNEFKLTGRTRIIQFKQAFHALFEMLKMPIKRLIINPNESQVTINTNNTIKIPQSSVSVSL